MIVFMPNRSSLKVFSPPEVCTVDAERLDEYVGWANTVEKRKERAANEVIPMMERY